VSLFSKSHAYDASPLLLVTLPLVSYVNLTSGTTVAHQYDADGNRVQTSVMPSGGSAVTTNMLVDTGCASCGGSGGLSQVIAETDGSGNIAAIYVRAGDELLEVMRPAGGATWTTRFVHHDGLGSVRALTDETGTTTDSRGYEAFGTKNTEAGNDPLAYGFAGEPFQAETSLAYHRASICPPGRTLTRDAPSPSIPPGRRVGAPGGPDGKDGSGAACGGAGRVAQVDRGGRTRGARDAGGERRERQRVRAAAGDRAAAVALVAQQVGTQLG
jgi:hypothetical protein